MLQTTGGVVQKWNEAGYLEFTDGDVVDHALIKEETLAWASGDSMNELAYDPWSATQFGLAVAAEGAPVVEVAQTVKNLSEAMKEAEAKIYAGRLHHDGNPVMTWMMSNVTVKPDKNENIFPNKSTPENKIDGPVAMFIAMSRLLVNGGDAKAFQRISKLTVCAHFNGGRPMRVLHFISVLSVLVGVAGAVLLTYGVWLIYPPAGFMIAGLLCLLWSWLVSSMLGRNPTMPDKEG